MTVSLSRTSPADMATGCDNPHMGGTMLTPWPEDPEQQGSGADGSAAKRGKFPKLFGCLAVLALASLGWAGWKALSVKQAREEAELAKASEYSSDESNGGGSSGFLPLFFGSSNGAVSSGAQRANITARGGSFSGMSSGS